MQRWSLTLSLASLLALPAAAQAEVFLLETGGRLEGQLLNPEEKPRETYVIQLAVGAELTLRKEQVKEVVRQRPEELEYEKLRPTYPDNVEGQMALADWCRQHHLAKQRERHLQRVIELEPDHAKARGALGFTRTESGWKTQRDIMTERGYVLYKGSWLMPQEVEIQEGTRKCELAEKDWAQKLKRWRGWLNGERAEEALRQLNQIADPYAAKPLGEALSREPDVDRRKLYIEALARIGTPQACQILALRSLDDPEEEARLTCLDSFDDQSHPEIVEFYVSKLRNKDNKIVNRAAVGLARMKDPMSIGPLIDALETTHKFKIVTGNNPGGYTGTFGNGPGAGGFSAGGGPQIISQRFQNQEVLDALVKLTGGQNFGYNVKAWKGWLASQKRPARLNGRRD